jgi:hypothetical protein
MQDNRVFITSEGIVEIQVVGDQTIDSVQAMGDRALELGAQQRAAGRPVILLDNLLRMGSVPPEARKRVAELVQSNDYDKLAMLGSDPLLRLGANLLLQATGKGKRVRYFEDRAACITWLLE